jgi:hypothetical protein
LGSALGVAARRLAVAVCTPNELSWGKSSCDWLTSSMWSASLFAVASSAQPNGRWYHHYLCWLASA